MENTKVVILQIKLTRQTRLLALAFALLCLHPQTLGSETLTLTTYYPAPYGAYVAILTTNQTLLARDGGAVGIGYKRTGTAKLAINGNVGVGTTTPLSTLDVKGTVCVGNYATAAAPPGQPGAIYYDTDQNAFMGFQGSPAGWSKLGGSSGGGGGVTVGGCSSGGTPCGGSACSICSAWGLATCDIGWTTNGYYGYYRCRCLSGTLVGNWEGWSDYGFSQTCVAPVTP